MKCGGRSNSGNGGLSETLSPNTVEVADVAVMDGSNAMVVAQQVQHSAMMAADLLVRTAKEEARHRFIAEASARLFASLDEDVTLAALSQVFVPALAVACSVFVFRDGSWRCVAASHSDTDKEAAILTLGHRLSCNGGKAGHLLDHVLNKRTRIVLSGKTIDGNLAPWCDAPDVSNMVSRLNVRRIVGLPLVVENSLLGALVLFDSSDGDEIRHHESPIFQDVTIRASLAAHHARQYQMAKCEVRAREHLMAAVSHDLRNLLSLALVSTAMLAQQENGSNSGSNRIVSLRKGLGRMQRLIDDLLDFASIEAGRLSLSYGECTLSILLAEVIELFRDQAERKKIRMITHVPLEPCIVECDEGRLLQVLTNMVGNALKFTPEGGAITLSVVDRHDHVEISVADTGPGIAAGDLSRIFEAYYRASPTREGGKGLGLAIAKGVVESHGGKVWVESRLGDGSTFFLRLPKRQPVDRPIGHATPVPPSPQ